MDTEATKLWEAKLGDEWITDLVWSEWQATDENTCRFWRELYQSDAYNLMRTMIVICRSSGIDVYWSEHRGSVHTG
jgi:hypothetical protein